MNVSLLSRGHYPPPLCICQHTVALPLPTAHFLLDWQLLRDKVQEEKYIIPVHTVLQASLGQHDDDVDPLFLDTNMARETLEIRVHPEHLTL